MQKIKKFFAVLLSVLMISGTSVATALTTSAKDFIDVNPDDKYSAQIDMLSDIGIIVGTSETEFDPNENVTREQMALLLYRFMTAKNNAGRVNTSPFTDLYEPFYNGAISWAYACRYILGTDADSFEPTGGIMLQDAIAMLTRALGHTNDKTNEGYPWSYIDIATRLKLTEGLEDVEYTQTLTRAQTAALLYNALTADYIISRTASGVTSTTITSVLEYVYGYKSGNAVIVASNNFALPSYSTVVKSGYALLNVTEKNRSAENVFVKVSDLGLAGDIDSHIGENINVFYKTNASTGIASILGAALDGKLTNASSFTVGSNNSYISINNVKYNVVENYSNATSTNANELIVYMFDEDGSLEQITSNAALAAKNGFFTMKLIGDGEIAKRAILMPLEMGKLEITSGSYNLADGLNKEALTGGIVNLDGAVNNDLVLYYYNSVVKRLVLAEKLEQVKNVQVTKLTDTTATVGGKLYKMGVEGTEYSAETVKASLTLGTKVDIVLFGDRIVSATTSSESTSENYNYLIAAGTVTPVVHNNTVCYFMKAFVGGKEVGVYVTNSSVTDGALYRYTENNDILTLIGVDESSFIQSGELKTVISSASSATIVKGNNVYYTLTNGGTSAKFVTDKDTIIAVKTENGLIYRVGTYASTFTVNDGANVVAIMNDEVGSVEKLKYLYISDGALGSAVDSTSYVQIVKKDANEFVNGKVMTSYLVLNIKNGSLGTMYSEHDNLSNGTIYALNELGHISDTEKSLSSGNVNGHTAGTVTIGENTYTLASDVKIISVEASGDTYSVKNHSLSSIYGKNVSYVANENTVSVIIVNN